MRHSERKAIERIEGCCGILLIAPHGCQGDDDNTGTLTRKVAQGLGCYAVINEIYRKPEKRKDPESGLMREVPDIGRRKINLNRFNQVERYAKEEFLLPILEFTERIIKQHGKAFVLWIHGIKDRNIPDNVMDSKADRVHVVLGIGQGNPGVSTADEEVVDRLIRCMKENPIKRINAALARKKSNYSGSHRNIMNQLFVRKGYGHSKVQSLQLEIKYTGFRDPGSIETSAGAISAALVLLFLQGTARFIRNFYFLSTGKNL